MKRVLVTTLLVLIATGLISGQTSNQKVIKDQAEYNAYIAALNTQDPAAKAAAMEAFVKQYPQSVVLSDALEQAMAGYQQANNQAKVVDVAKQILLVNPNNVRALAILAAIDRAIATGGGAGAAAALKEACSSETTGLPQLSNWPKPEGMSDADFDKLRNQLADIFNGVGGFCALQAKDYAGATKYYVEAVRLDPANLQDTYQLSVAELEQNPMNLTGLWYGVKALNLAKGNAAAEQSIANYVKFKYKKYHGKADDWDKFVATVTGQTAPPANLAELVPPAPTPCDLAVQVVKENDPGQLAIEDWEFILSQTKCSPANKDAADKVWKAIQDKQKGGEAKLKLPIKVIAATNDAIEAAITDENQKANKADLHVVLEEPIPPPVRKTAKSNVPAAGSTTDVVGVLTSYTPDPFMFTMEKAELPGLAKPKPPVHHPATHKKAAR